MARHRSLGAKDFRKEGLRTGPFGRGTACVRSLARLGTHAPPASATPTSTTTTTRPRCQAQPMPRQHRPTAQRRGAAAVPPAKKPCRGCPPSPSTGRKGGFSTSGRKSHPSSMDIPTFLTLGRLLLPISSAEPLAERQAFRPLRLAGQPCPFTCKVWEFGGRSAAGGFK